MDAVDTRDPRDTRDTLAEIEAIQQLKARYCRFLDTKDWAGWRTVFSDDFVSDTSESGGKVIEGGDAFVAFVRSVLETKSTVHQVHGPEIELTSATTATGVWALEDWVRFAPGFNLHGYGHYHETYVKTGGQWRIASSKLTRVREDLATPVLTVFFSDRVKRLLSGLGDRIAKK